MMTFEEWRATIQVQISERTQSELQRLHGVDAAAEVESALIHEYNRYVQEQTGKTNDN